MNHLEKKLINVIGRRDLNKGPLTNLTDGGEGLAISEAPIWLREVKSSLVKGTKNPMFGKTHSPEARRLISKHLKEGYANGSITPTVHTEEHKQKLRDNK